MAFAEAPDDIGLHDSEALVDSVLQVFVKFFVVEPLKQEPAGITKVEEWFAVLIDEVAAVRAHFELKIFDGTGCWLLLGLETIIGPTG